MTRKFALGLLGLCVAFATPTLAGGEGCDGCPEGGAKPAKQVGCCGDESTNVDDKTAKAGDCGDCEGCGEQTATRTSETFEKVKSLAGEWETAPDKDGNVVKVTYKVTSNGTAVVETIMPGTAHEMITVYHLDNEGKLMLTHYCAMGSQPRMRVTKSEGSTITFEFVDGANCDPAKGFMGGLAMTVAGDTLKNEWVVLKDGKAANKMVFEFTKAGTKKSTK